MYLYGNTGRQRVNTPSSCLCSGRAIYLFVLFVFCVKDASLLTSTSHAVQRGLFREGFANFQSSWVFVVTWHNVSALPVQNSSQINKIWLHVNHFDELV